MVELSQQRLVPGAPPPIPLSKTQKRKRKAKAKSSDPASPETPSTTIPDVTVAALVEKAPEANDIAEGHVASDLVAQPEEPKVPEIPPEESGGYKRSPIVDVIHKRLKANGRKISRLQSYAAMDVKELNEDQLRGLKTLPNLELIQKELEEVKKAIEAREAELAQEKALKQIEAAKAEKERVAAAVSVAETAFFSKTSKLLSFIRLHTLLSNEHFNAAFLGLAELETSAVYAATEVLLGEDSAVKENTIQGLLTGIGDFNGISFNRLIEVTHISLQPPRIPTPVADIPEDVQADALQDSTISMETISTEIPPVTGVPRNAGVSSGFQFMQSSELEEPTYDENADWVDAGLPTEETAGGEEVAEAVVEEVTAVVEENGHIIEQDVVVSIDTETNETPGETAPGAATIDWADDEGGLPSIAGLHAEFGTSDPVSLSVDQTAEGKQPVDGAAPPAPVNGIQTNGVAHQHDEDDGFTQARPGRGGRGFRGGERGAMRGGFRGGDRGFRNGDRGFRGGDRGFRGGDRGSRGFRGGDRGGFRGRPSNGDWRSDGEFRGRGGRGRGRGGFQEPHNGIPVAAE